MSANLAEVRCDGNLHVDLGEDDARLSVVLEEVGGRFEVRARTLPGQALPLGSPQPLSILPPDCAAHGSSAQMHFMRHLFLRFDLGILAGMAEDEIDVSSALRPRLMFHDPGIMRLAQLIAEECAGDEPNARLYGDNLAIALLVALSRRSVTRPPSFRNGRLAPWQLRRVIDYLVAHLAEDVELQTISDLARLSRSYFSRAFKLSTGLAPHQWLMQARIARAQELLLTSGPPLAQIAIDVGFSDQAHFSRAFRRAVGESPGAWQRARRA